MTTEESKVPAAAGTEPEPTPAPEMVKVTAVEDCNILINGQSIALTKGQEVEMTPEEAKAYADLGLVEAPAGKSLPGGEADARTGIPKRK